MQYSYLYTRLKILFKKLSLSTNLLSVQVRLQKIKKKEYFQTRGQIFLYDIRDKDFYMFPLIINFIFYYLYQIMRIITQ